MAFISPGMTFLDNVPDMLSSAAIGTFMTNALVTGISFSELRSTAIIIQSGSSAPVSDQGEGSYWYDTALGILRQKNAGRWDCPYLGPSLSSSAGTIPKGAWVNCSGDGTMSACTTASDPGLIGVVISTCASGDQMVAQTHGFFPARCIGPVTYGDVLIAADVTFGVGGWAMAATMVYGTSSFGNGIEVGMALGSVAASTTGTITCMIFR